MNHGGLWSKQNIKKPCCPVHAGLSPTVFEAWLCNDADAYLKLLKVYAGFQCKFFATVSKKKFSCAETLFLIILNP